VTPSASAVVALGPAGSALYASVSGAHELDVLQEVLLVEACRAKDRADKLHAVVVGDPEVWARLGAAGAAEGPVQVRLDAVMREVNRNALLVSQLLGAMRLPDPDTGRRPRRRPPRGVYRPRHP
jgi:hypothetical protein